MSRKALIGSLHQGVWPRPAASVVRLQIESKSGKGRRPGNPPETGLVLLVQLLRDAEQKN